MTIYFINWVADYELKMIQYLKKKHKIKNITTPKKYNWVNKKISKLGMDNASVSYTHLTLPTKLEV